MQSVVQELDGWGFKAVEKSVINIAPSVHLNRLYDGLKGSSKMVRQLAGIVFATLLTVAAMATGLGAQGRGRGMHPGPSIHTAPVSSGPAFAGRVPGSGFVGRVPSPVTAPGIVGSPGTFELRHQRR